ncbi:MAG: hypothetical protein ABEK12_02885, partial [Candidatus Nanohaloarchaea archaeon]
MSGRRITFSDEEWEERKDELPDGLVERAEPLEDVFFFEPSREIVVVNPAEETLRKISKVAHLASSSDDLFKFEVDRMDLWNADLSREEAKAIFEDILPRDYPNFIRWVDGTFDRAEIFTITKEGPYYVLQAADGERMEYARQVDGVADHLVADVTDTKSRIESGSKARAEIKEALLDKGYPVEDDYEFREVDTELGLEMAVDLYDYQQEMLDK